MDSLLPAFTKTVRFKLTLWYSGLMLVFGIAFIVSLNLAARFDRPVFEISGRLTVVSDGPGQALIIPREPLTLQEAEDSLYEQNLQSLRTWSLISIIGLAVASGIGGYMLSGMLLRPVRDITEVASAISATNLSRRINHQGPDDELKTLADTFDSMIGRLERSFAEQRLFVQDASHELRTPLAAIRTNIEVLEMDPEATNEEYRELLDTVKVQTERLARLSDDLMLLSTSEGEVPELEPVGLAAITREVLSQLQHSADIRKVSLRADTDAGIEAMADPDLLYRCVFNLVDNAVKYSGEGAGVTITSRQDGAMAVVEVADNGAGIPSDQLGAIFDRFYRVDRGRSRREGGSGLGLAIVKELVTSMGGSVHVASTLGAGTTFTLRLPAVPESSGTRDTAPERNLRTARASG
jgi:signal transduction histidine kinase